MRNFEEYSPRKDPSKFRILLLGPSFAFGWGVNYEDTFGVILRRLLEENDFIPGKSIEVINAGVPALGPGPQLTWYEHVGRTYHPDLVVQLIYGSMVVPNGRRAGAQVDAEGYLVRAGPGVSWRAVNRAKQSALIFYAWILGQRMVEALHPASNPRGIAGSGRHLKIDTRFRPDDEGVADALRFYKDLRQAAESGDARLLIVFLPLSYVVHEQDIARWRHLGVADIGGQIEFDRAFCDHLNRTGFHVVNTTQELVSDASRTRQRLYYWLDVHWTPRGNQIAARAASDYILGNPRRKWFAGETDR